MAKTYTEQVEEIATELGIEYAVAMDIHYLRSLEKRIILCFRKNPHLRDFPVEHMTLEYFLESNGVSFMEGQ